MWLNFHEFFRAKPVVCDWKRNHGRLHGISARSLSSSFLEVGGKNRNVCCLVTLRRIIDFEWWIMDFEWLIGR